MRNVWTTLKGLAALPLVLAPAYAWPATPAEIQKGYEAAARGAAPAFSGFSSQRGEQFFKSKHGSDWSCASCHTDNPLGPGRHAKTGKSIAALAPGANPQRFTDAAGAEKWFRRNCNDVLGRACTVQEKGDVLQYLLSLK
jgi:hypothetical protein